MCHTSCPKGKWYVQTGVPISARLVGDSFLRSAARACMSGGKRNHEDLSDEMALLEAALKAHRVRTKATHTLPVR